MQRNRKEYEIGQRRNQQLELRKKVRQNGEKLDRLLEKIKALKERLAALRSDQLKYYHDLLAEGRDCRQDGLAWIVKAIWLLGHDVNLTRLPKFLDPQAIECIFKVDSSFDFDRADREIGDACLGGADAVAP